MTAPIPVIGADQLIGTFHVSQTEPLNQIQPYPMFKEEKGEGEPVSLQSAASRSEAVPHCAEVTSQMPLSTMEG